MTDEDIDENWTEPLRPRRPLPQVARLTEERDRLRALLVKACVEMANRDRIRIADRDGAAYIASIFETYGIRLRWTGETFEEDTK